MGDKFESREIEFQPHNDSKLRYIRRIETKLVEDFSFEYLGGALKKPEQFARLFSSLAEKDRENGIVLYLDFDYMPIGYDLWLGGVDFVSIDPRRVITLAGQLLASRIVFAHNHPQGDPEPSGPDTMMCMQMGQVSRLMGWELTDFLVIGRNGFYSFREKKHPALGDEGLPPSVTLRSGRTV